MKTLALKLEDEIFTETESLLPRLKKSGNRYINEAVEYYNRLNRRKLFEKQLAKESKIVREDSMRVLRDFEKIG